MSEGHSRQPVQGSPLAKTGTIWVTKWIVGFNLINVDGMVVLEKSPFGDYHSNNCFSQELYTEQKCKVAGYFT